MTFTGIDALHRRAAAMQLDTAWLQARRDVEAQRRSVLPGMLALVNQLLKQEIEAVAFAQAFHLGALQKWTSFGLHGTGFAMVLNGWAKYILDADELTEEMRALFSAPTSVDAAEKKLRRFDEWLERRIEAEDVERRLVRPFSTPSIASVFWHVQAHDRWPIFYKSARRVLGKAGLYREDKRDPPGSYRQFVEEYEAAKQKLAQSTYEFETLCAWEQSTSPPPATTTSTGGGRSEAPEETIFLSDEDQQLAVDALRDRKNLVLKGPPGSGKTFVARLLARKLDPDAEIRRVQLHPSYTYEDFVRGYRPTQSGFSLRPGPLLDACDRARSVAPMPVVLIIDEINRADLSRVLGEAFSLLEADKREARHAVRLSYAERDDEPPFWIPPNLYVIGTMNSADRSIAMVDYALRRRFAFLEVPPAFESETFTTWLVDRGLPEAFVERFVTAMQVLNEQIREDRNLGRGYEIGHSYFCSPASDEHEAWYRRIVNTQIRPLLEEYWFGQPDKVKSSLQALLVSETP